MIEKENLGEQKFPRTCISASNLQLHLQQNPEAPPEICFPHTRIPQALDGGLLFSYICAAQIIRLCFLGRILAEPHRRDLITQSFNS